MTTGMQAPVSQTFMISVPLSTRRRSDKFRLYGRPDQRIFGRAAARCWRDGLKAPRAVRDLGFRRQPTGVPCIRGRGQPCHGARASRTANLCAQAWRDPIGSEAVAKAPAARKQERSGRGPDTVTLRKSAGPCDRRVEMWSSLTMGARSSAVLILNRGGEAARSTRHESPGNPVWP